MIWATLLLLSPLLIMLVAVAVLIIYNMLISQGHLQPVVAGGAGPTMTEGFESATFLADNWDGAVKTNNTTVDASADCTRSTNFYTAGSYGLEIAPGTNTEAIYVDLGATPTGVVKVKFQNHTAGGRVYVGYGATISGDNDLEGGVISYIRMDSGAWGVGTMAANGEPGWNGSEVVAHVNATTYILEVSISGTTGTARYLDSTGAEIASQSMTVVEGGNLAFIGAYLGTGNFDEFEVTAA